MTLQNFDLSSDTPFFVGCNYWASHAGIAMWSDWQPEVVAEDFAQIGRAGLEVARVFPLWPEFQPLKVLRTGGGAPSNMDMATVRWQTIPRARPASRP